MDTKQAKCRIAAGEFDSCSVMPSLEGDGFRVDFEAVDSSHELYRARGVPARYGSIDSAVTAARRAGWTLMIEVFP